MLFRSEQAQQGPSMDLGQVAAQDAEKHIAHHSQQWLQQHHSTGKRQQQYGQQQQIGDQQPKDQTDRPADQQIRRHGPHLLHQADPQTLEHQSGQQTGAAAACGEDQSQLFRVRVRIDQLLRQQMDAVFAHVKSGRLKRVAIAQGNPRLWSRVRLTYSNVSVVDNKATLDLVLNAPEDFLNQSVMNSLNQQMLNRAKEFGVDDLDMNISVIPNRVYKFDN